MNAGDAFKQHSSMHKTQNTWLTRELSLELGRALCPLFLQPAIGTGREQGLSTLFHIYSVPLLFVKYSLTLPRLIACRDLMLLVSGALLAHSPWFVDCLP